MQLQAELMSNPNLSQVVRKRIQDEFKNDREIINRKPIHKLPIDRLCTAFVEAFLQMNFELYHSGFDIRFR